MRLSEKFTQLRQEHRKAFIAYVPFGYPSPKDTPGICCALQDAGVDVIELGVPFSDPLADGPVIQKASVEALKHGATVEAYFATLKRIRKDLRIPVVTMTYYNPVLAFGLQRFFRHMKEVSLRASLIVDVPVEEAGEYIKAARSRDIDTVFFVTPTTSRARMERIVQASRGFIYYISVTGITGERSIGYASIAGRVRSLKAMTRLPVCVGFGIHTRSQVKEVCGFADGAIVGSGIVSCIEKNYGRRDFYRRLTNYTASLCAKS